MRRGVDVILLEKGAFGQEAASALNAGQFLTGWAKPVDVMLGEPPVRVEIDLDATRQGLMPMNERSEQDPSAPSTKCGLLVALP